jgi:hypothetical protein
MKRVLLREDFLESRIFARDENQPEASRLNFKIKSINMIVFYSGA